MAKLNLNFLENPYDVDMPNIISTLEDFGKEISDYGKEYLSYTVTSTSTEGVLHDCSLYIIAPEIGYDYKVISVEILNINVLKISFFTLITKEVKHYSIDISNGLKAYEEKLSELLSNPLFNKSLRFIIDQIQFRKAS